MKVLHVVNISFVLPYFLGDQIEYFRKKGIEFHIVCSPSDHLYSFANEKSVKVFGIPIVRRVNFFQDAISIYKIFKLIAFYKYSIVVGHTPKGGLIAMLAAYIMRVPKRVYFRHGLVFETSIGLQKYILLNLERLTARLATEVVSVSNSVMRSSQELKLNNPVKDILLGSGTANGVDSSGKFNPKNINLSERDRLRDQLKIRPNEIVVGFVGRLVKDKGIIELYDAWLQIKVKYPNSRLLLIGPFEERDSISDAIKQELSLDESVILTGTVNHTELYYSLMNIFILPSYREGFPTVVLEASSMEIPVLTSRSTGCVDSIINDHTGLFLEINASDIERKISTYMENPDLAVAHGKNGRLEIVRHYEQNYIWEQLAKTVYKVSN